MKNGSKIFKAIILVFILTSNTSAKEYTSAAKEYTSASKQDTSSPNKYVPGEIIVKFKSDTDVDSLNNSLYRQFNIKPEDIKRLFPAMEITNAYGNFERVKSTQEMIEETQAKYPKRSGKNTVPVKNLENIVVIKVPAGREQEAVQTFRQDSSIEYAELNIVYQPFQSDPSGSRQLPRYKPNDPYFPSQWALKKMKAHQAWNLFSNPARIGKGILIAVLDTGVAHYNSELAENIWLNPGELSGGDLNNDGEVTLQELSQHPLFPLTDNNQNGYLDPGDIFGTPFENGVDSDSNGHIDDFVGWDFGSDPVDNNPAGEADWHGTNVAGAASAVTNNLFDIAGTSWYSRILPISVYRTPCFSADCFTSSNVAQGIIYSANQGADIINMSFGEGMWPSGEPSQIVEEALIYASHLGVIPIAAAGNDSTDHYYYPAAYRQVISVGATDSNDTLADFSNYGSWVDIAAPGKDVLCLGGLITSGTSFSAPSTAGVVALLLSHHQNLGSGILRVDIVRYILRNTADPIEDYIDPGTHLVHSIDRGRVNALSALAEDGSLRLLARIHNLLTIYSSIPDIVDIHGLAAGDDFNNYTLYYKEKYNSSQRVQIGQTQYEPVYYGNLITDWDTSQLPQGFYELILEIKNAEGTLTTTDKLDFAKFDFFVPHTHTTIQQAIDASSHHNVIFVDKGSYNENINFKGKAITLKSRLGAGINGGSNHAVTFNSGERHDSILDGFTLNSNIFSGSGGAIFIDGASPTIKNNNITYSISADGGAGIRCQNNASPLIIDNVISDNATFQNSGGGIACFDSSPVLINNTISRNRAIQRGGGIYLAGNSHIKMFNSIIWDNYAPIDPNISIEPNSTASIKYSDIQGGWPGPGNINSNPGFIGGGHLGVGSPCIDAGDGNHAPASDLDGRLRYDDPNITNTGIGNPDYTDMGAYERQTSQ